MIHRLTFIGTLSVLLLAGCVANNGATTPGPASLSDASPQATEAGEQNLSAAADTPAKPGEQPATASAESSKQQERKAETETDQKQNAAPSTDVAATKPSTATKMVVGVPVQLKPTARIVPDDAPMTGASYAPRMGRDIFRCNGGRRMAIDVSRQAAVMVDPEGESITLAAAPPGQSSRFARKGYSLVLDNGEALYTKPGRPPFDCRH